MLYEHFLLKITSRITLNVRWAGCETSCILRYIAIQRKLYNLELCWRQLVLIIEYNTQRVCSKIIFTNCIIILNLLLPQITSCSVFQFRINSEIINPFRHMIRLIDQSQSFCEQRTKQHRK